MQIDHKRPRLKIVHEQQHDYLVLEGKSFLVLNFESDPARHYEFGIKNEMDRVLSLRLDSAGQIITFTREQACLAPGETRMIGMNLQPGGWQAVILRVADTELAFPIKITVRD